MPHLPEVTDLLSCAIPAFANSLLWQSVGLKGNRLQKRLAGSYFAAFSTNRITISLQNPQNLPSPSHFFAAILQVRQTAGACQYYYDSDITMTVRPGGG
jgi:hypothetical protein